MSVLHPHTPPASGIQGLKEHWRNDLMAAFSVSMVALPLSMGLAYASKVPVTAGLFAAIISGLVTTFIRGSHLGINGPGNGLVAVILMGVISFKGDPNTFRYVLAAIVVAGFLQVLLGVFRLGKLGEIFPSSAIHGILVAIGLIILGKQMHVALGVETKATGSLAILLDIPNSVLKLNPYVAMISVLCLAILVIYPRIQNKLIHLIPAPMWVLLVATPLAIWLGFSSKEPYQFWGQSFTLGPDFLVPIPKDMFNKFYHPSFAKIHTFEFWSLVISITLISSIETMISAKAVDKLDPYKRTTDPNRELIGVGLSSVLSGCLGGLPIVTVIARSSVNIHNYAKTRWSNFFHGAFLLIFVIVFAPIIRLVPLSALAAILVYTGYKLAQPKVFRDAHKKGWEQLLFLVITLAATLLSNLVWGLLVGTAFTLLFHIIRTGTSPEVFFHSLWQTHFVPEEHGGQRRIAPAGIVNFGNILRLQNTLNALPAGGHIALDFRQAPLVDLTVLEYVDDVAQQYRHEGGKFDILGLEFHQSSSSYPHSLRILGAPLIAIPERPVQLSRRQYELKDLAEQHGWDFKFEIDWDASYLKNFQFFETRPLEYKENVLSGEYEDLGIGWEIADLTFDEGAILVEEFHTTVQILFHKWRLPEFVVEREELYDRLMEALGHEEVDFKFFTELSTRFVAKGYNRKDIESFFTKEHIAFFESHDIYHLESNGEALLVFRRFRLERPNGIMAMHKFSKELLDELRPDYEGTSWENMDAVTAEPIPQQEPAVVLDEANQEEEPEDKGPDAGEEVAAQKPEAASPEAGESPDDKEPQPQSSEASSDAEAKKSDGESS